MVPEEFTDTAASLRSLADTLDRLASVVEEASGSDEPLTLNARVVLLQLQSDLLASCAQLAVFARTCGRAAVGEVA